MKNHPRQEITKKTQKNSKNGSQNGARRVPGELLGPSRTPPGGARETPGSLPRLPGLLGAAPGEPQDHFGMQNGAKTAEIIT